MTPDVKYEIDFTSGVFVLLKCDEKNTSLIERLITEYDRLILFDSNENDFNKYMKNSNIIDIKKSEADRILDLYRCYEFCDRVILVSDGKNYGSIVNYIQTGVLTSEEVAKALMKDMAVGESCGTYTL